MSKKYHIGLISLFLLLFLVFLIRPVFVSPPSIDTANRFDTARAFDSLSRLLGDERPHPVDSAANDDVRERLIAEIRSMGFKPMIRDQFSCQTGRGNVTCARVHNVLFWVSEPGPDAVMLASHYDSVPAGPGASDDGSGVASSLEIARLLKSHDFNRPFLVLITDGEEAGLLGAKAFVGEDPLASQIGAIVNMRTVVHVSDKQAQRARSRCINW